MGHGYRGNRRRIGVFFFREGAEFRGSWGPGTGAQSRRAPPRKRPAASRAARSLSRVPSRRRGAPGAPRCSSRAPLRGHRRRHGPGTERSVSKSVKSSSSRLSPFFERGTPGGGGRMVGCLLCVELLVQHAFLEGVGLLGQRVVFLSERGQRRLSLLATAREILPRHEHFEGTTRPPRLSPGGEGGFPPQGRRPRAH